MFFVKFMVLITNPKSEFTLVASLVLGIQVESCQKVIILGFRVVFSVSVRVTVQKCDFSSCPNIWRHVGICLESCGHVVPCGTG